MMIFKNHIIFLSDKKTSKIKNTKKWNRETNLYGGFGEDSHKT